MLTNQRVEDIDQLLNELEREAQSSLSSAAFFAHLLQRVRLLLDADSVAILAPTGTSWLTIAHSGSFSEAITKSFEDVFSSETSPAATLSSASKSAAESSHQRPSPTTLRGSLQGGSLHGSQLKAFWFAVPLRTENFSKGCLIVSFQSAPPSVAVPGMLELLAAFAEVLALRQLAELEDFLDNRWEKLQQLCTTLLEGSRSQDGPSLLVNHLVPIFGAARVSYFGATTLGSLRLEKVSGTTTFVRNAQVVRTLTQLAQSAFKDHKPQLRQQRVTAQASDVPLINEDGTFGNSLSLPLMRDSQAKRCDSVIVIEWPDYEHLIAATASVVHMLPTLSLAWQQHRRWQRVPGALRMLGSRSWSFPLWGSRLLVACIAALILAVVYGLLAAPYPLTIEAVGTIEPKLHRTVFTPLDGYVNELLVEDGQAVEAGQPLARIQSPDLELRNEQLVGELRTIQEKRNALQIASNQLNPSANDSLANQNRIAAEIKQLETQAENLNAQLALVREESTKNLIRSPIRGVIVAKDMQQQLASRPLRRGDALFRVVDMEGPWHLNVRVADRDSGYVLNGTKDTAQSTETLRFVLDSLPGEQFDARVEWISRTVENRNGEGCFIEMHAAVDRNVVSKSYMGASARAYFRCGDQPTWFVWCRPLVESIQRRLWFWR